MWFADRSDAGQRLAGQLESLRDQDVVVLAVPRGGVPVGFELAMALGAALDVVMTRKLTSPSWPGRVLGAIAECGIRVTTGDAALLPPEEIAAAERWGHAELERQAERYRSAQPGVEVAGRTVIVTDDGVATGATVRAACQAARARGAGRVVLAVPVAPAAATGGLRRAADQLVCLLSPVGFTTAADWYEDFRPVSDAQIVDLLTRAALPLPPAGR